MKLILKQKTVLPLALNKQRDQTEKHREMSAMRIEQREFSVIGIKSGL